MQVRASAAAAGEGQVRLAGQRLDAAGSGGWRQAPADEPAAGVGESVRRPGAARPHVSHSAEYTDVVGDIACYSFLHPKLQNCYLRSNHMLGRSTVSFTVNWRSIFKKLNYFLSDLSGSYGL